MVLPPSLPEEVNKIDTGMYRFYCLYLRFNRMESSSMKWSAHYRAGSPVRDFVKRNITLRGLICNVISCYDELLKECNDIENDEADAKLTVDII